MNGSRSSGKSNDFFALPDELLEIIFKAVDIGAKRNNPISIKCFLNIFLLIAREMAEAKEDSVFTSFHIVLHFLV